MTDLADFEVEFCAALADERDEPDLYTATRVYPSVTNASRHAAPRDDLTLDDGVEIDRAFARDHRPSRSTDQQKMRRARLKRRMPRAKPFFTKRAEWKAKRERISDILAGDDADVLTRKAI